MGSYQRHHLLVEAAKASFRTANAAEPISRCSSAVLCGVSCWREAQTRRRESLSDLLFLLVPQSFARAELTLSGCNLIIARVYAFLT